MLLQWLGCRMHRSDVLLSRRRLLVVGGLLVDWWVVGGGFVAGFGSVAASAGPPCAPFLASLSSVVTGEPRKATETAHGRNILRSRPRFGSNLEGAQTDHSVDLPLAHFAPNLLLKLAEFTFPRGPRYASCGASRHQYVPASLLQYAIMPCHLMTPLEALARDATNFPLAGRLDTVVSSTPSAEPR